MPIQETPYPLTTYPSSPLWQLTPVSSNSSLGWAPNCTASDCIPTASWSTGTVNSTVTYMYYAWGHTIFGTVEGDMKLQLIRNGKEEAINPSGDILFTSPGNAAESEDDLHQNLTIKVIEANNGARLTVNKAFINGSSFVTDRFPSNRWTLASNDGALKYTGFVQQQATAGLPSPTTYVSSAVGDKVSMQYSGNAFTVYGPCGPSNGLMRVIIDGKEETTNTTKPFQSDDCLLYQSPGISSNNFHSLEIDNVDGRTLAINRIEFFHVLVNANSRNATMTAAKIAGIVIGVIVGIAALIILYSTRSRKSRQKINNSWKIFCG